MSKIRLAITEEDIGLGLPQNPYSCAFVMALRRTYPKMTPTLMTDGKGGHTAFLHESVGGVQPALVLRATFHLSKNASKAVKLFDRGGFMKPATFELTKVDAANAA